MSCSQSIILTHQSFLFLFVWIQFSGSLPVFDCNEDFHFMLKMVHSTGIWPTYQYCIQQIHECNGTVTIHCLAKVIKYINISCLHPIHERMIAYLLWCIQVLWLVVTFIVNFVIKILEKPISPFSFSLKPT